MTRRYLIRTFGCQMNEHDSERLAGLLAAEGMEATDDVEAADVVLLNTCCIRENADNKLYGHLGHLKALKQRRPHVQIAVGGCLAQKDRDLIQRRAPHVDVVFGTHNVGHAAALLRRAAIDGPQLEILEESAAFPSALPVRRDVAHAAWVTIQIGCDNSCAFCIVPAVRGREISRPFDEVVAEVEALVASGVVEVTLLGQNVNSYGRDLMLERRHAGEPVHARPLFADLLRALADVDGLRRIRFTSPHPKDFRGDTVAAMATGLPVCPHLHLPLQSGSDRTLAAMRRGYTAERYLERLRMARAEIPDLAVTTDLIVGFPGESDDDFEDSLAVVAEAAYDGAYTFVFSPRPGTPAAARTDTVAHEVAVERLERLKVVVERSALARHEARIGRVEEVLVEGPSKTDPALVSGRTPHNKLVHFSPAAPAPPLPGEFVAVRVTGASPHFLRGVAEAGAAPAAAPRRRRIPVVPA